MIGAISNALSGLLAASKKVEAGASNIANLQTTGALDPADGPAPYAARTSVQTALDHGGVKSEIVQKNPGFVEAFAPDSLFANADGLIGVPNVDLAEEAVSLKVAEAAYKANVTALKAAEDMGEELFRIFDDEV